MARRVKSGSASRRRRVPTAEGLESRQLLAVVTTGYVVPSVNGVFLDTTSSITDGPDGNLWFTATGSAGQFGQLRTTSEIGKISPASGGITLYPTKTPSTHLSSIISGPGGDLYYLSNNTGSGVLSIGEVNPATGADVEFAVGKASANDIQPGLAVGADGNLWFTDPAVGTVDEFSPTSHATVKFPLPTSNSGPGGIVSGPGGLLWFTEVGAFTQATPPYNYGSITSIDPTTHAIVRHATTYAPIDLTVGPNNQLWFDEVNSLGVTPTYYIGSFNAANSALIETTVTRNVQGGLTTGPDGQVWFTGGFGGEISPSTRLVVQFFSSVPASGIVTGPDNNIWFTNGGLVEKAAIIPKDQAVIQGVVDTNYAGLGSTMLGPQGGLTVYLDLNDDGRLDPGEPSTVAVSGGYTFAGLTPGKYTVRVAYPANITTFPGGDGATVDAVAGQVSAPYPLGVAPGTAILPLTYSTNPFGTANPDVQTAEVNGLYRILFNRAADPTGLTNAVAYLKNGGSLQSLTLILEDTGEYDARVVSQDYETFLGRVGAPSEVAAWVSLMRGGDSAEQVADLMLNSTEFNLAHPTGASFVQALYTDVLGRQASDAEVAGWGTLMTSALSRAAVAHDFVFGTPAMTAAVDGFAAIFEAAGPDTFTEAYAVSFLTTGRLTLAQVASAFAASTAFVRRANATVG